MAERRKLTLWAGFSQYSHKHLVFATGRDNTGASALIQSACLPIPATGWFLAYSEEASSIFYFLTHTWIQGLSGTPLWVGDSGGGHSAHQHVASAHRHVAILVIQTLEEEFRDFSYYLKKIALILYAAFWLHNEVGSPSHTKLAVKFLL